MAIQFNGDRNVAQPKSEITKPAIHGERNITRSQRELTLERRIEALELEVQQLRADKAAAAGKWAAYMREYRKRAHDKPAA